MPPHRTVTKRFQDIRLLAALLLALLLVACESRGATTATTVRGGTPATVGSGSWQHLSLPVPNADVIGFAPSPTDANTLYACTGHVVASRAAPMTLWRTTDAGAHWTNFGALAGLGVNCAISIAPDDAQRVLVQISSGVDKGVDCSTDSDYLSDDGGATWKHLPPYDLHMPDSTPFDWCFLEMTRDHLFLVFGSTESTIATSLLARSDDDGQTWRRIDGGLGNDALFFPPAIGPDDQLAMTVEHARPQAGQAANSLWMSSDAGATWSKTSDLPGYPGPFLLSSFSTGGGTWPSASHPLYALANEQIPSDLFRESVLASDDGVHWSLLPPLPVPGVTGDRRGILQVLAALPDGRLAAWGADPLAGVPSENGQAYPQTHFSLWLWAPDAGTWQSVSTPLNITADEGCGLCWQGAASTAPDGSLWLYASRFYTDPTGEPPAGLYRLRIPSA